LGHPFFYHHEPEKICNSAILFKTKSQVAILGAQYNNASDDRFWLKGRDIHWATQQLFRNSEHPILNEFCAVPMDISALFSDFQAFKSTLRAFSNGMHNYCSSNYDMLYKRFIFYYESMKDNHCIVHVAINPFAALNRQFYPKEDPEYEYGYFAYNPLQCVEEEPEDSDDSEAKALYNPDASYKSKKEDRRQLVFILNLLLYYQDLAIHGLLEEAQLLETWDALWGIGGRGPFGCYLHPKMGVGYTDNKKSQVSWMPGRYTNKKSNLLLYQKDAFNCGLFCTLFVFDLVLTQWGKE
jgi:hypothetical protein